MTTADRFLDALGSYRGGGRIADWSVYASEGSRVSLPTKDRQTGNVHAPFAATDTSVVSFKLVWDDGRVSRGSVERSVLDFGTQDILDQARREANLDPDSAYVLSSASYPDVALHAEDAQRLAEGFVDAWTRRFERLRATVGEGGFRTWSASFSATSTVSCVRTSRGVDAKARSTTASWWASLDGEHGDGKSGRSLERDDEFEARLVRMSRTAALLRVPADGGRGGVRAVLLHPDVVASLVLETLLHHLDAKTVHQKEGWFHKEDFGSGHAALREDVLLRIDPLRPLAPGSYRFTQDGLPASRCDYVLGGCLQTPVASLKYARALGTAPTPLPYGTDGLVLEAGASLGLEEAFERSPGGALVLSVLGVHTLDPSSGDFSLSAPQVLRMEPGGPTGRFRATLSGNLLALLRSESLRTVRFPGERHPGLLVECRIDPR